MAKRTQQENDLRSLKYAIVYDLTKDSTLARNARDWSAKTFNKRVKGYKLPNDFISYKIKTVRKRKKKKINSITLPQREINVDIEIPDIVEDQSKYFDFIDDKKDYRENFDNLIYFDYKSKNDRKRAYYDIARKAGYTPAEADRLKGWSPKSFKDFIDSGEVLDYDSREARWAALSHKGYKLDENLVDLAEQINIDNGIEANARYGYGVVYAWYLNGGDIRDFITGITPDPLIPDIYYGIDKYLKKRN